MKLKLCVLTVAALTLFACGAKKEKVAEVAKPSAEAVAGQELYENKCGKCHKLYSPKDYTHEAWKPILVRMQKKAKLDDAQMANIDAYIQYALK